MSPFLARLRLQRLGGFLSDHGAPFSPAALMLLLGLWGIGNMGLGNDEHCTWWAAHLAWPDFLRLISHADAVLAPYYLLIRLFISLFGDSELALRLPSTLGMAVAALLTTQLGRRLGGTFTGLLAGLIFALTPSISSYAQEARPYAISVAMAVGSVLLLLRALDGRDAKTPWVAYGFSLVLVGLTHLVGLSLLAGQAPLLLGTQQKFPWFRLNRGIVPWLVAVILALCVLAPLGYICSTQSGQLHVIPMSLAELGKLRQSLTEGHYYGSLLMAASGLCLLRRRRFTGMLALWALVPPVFFYLTYDALHIFRARYFLFTIPAWSLLAAMGCTGLTKRSRLNAAIGAALLVSVAVDAYPAHRSMRREATAKNSLAPYRYAGAILERHAQPEDAIIYGGTGGGRYHNRLGIEYALRDTERPRDILEQVKAAELGKFQSRECSTGPSCIPKETERVWLLTDLRQADPFVNLAPKIAATLKHRFRESRKWALGRKRLYLFETAASQRQPYPQSEQSSEDDTSDVGSDGHRTDVRDDRQ